MGQLEGFVQLPVLLPKYQFLALSEDERNRKATNKSRLVLTDASLE
jgi:hypothetical protein